MKLLAIPKGEEVWLREVNPYYCESRRMKLGGWNAFESVVPSFLCLDPSVKPWDVVEGDEFELVWQYLATRKGKPSHVWVTLTEYARGKAGVFETAGIKTRQVYIRLQPAVESECYPGSQYQELFDHMSEEHNLTLLQSQMDDIIAICKRFLKQDTH